MPLTVHRWPWSKIRLKIILRLKYYINKKKNYLRNSCKTFIAFKTLISQCKLQNNSFFLNFFSINKNIIKLKFQIKI